MVSRSLSPVRRLYYRLKPFLPHRVRWALRRGVATRILRESEGVWPIDESTGAKPNEWAGWPDGKKFALVLTHDVESQIGVDKVRQLAELEMEFGFRSSFNFIPEGAYEVPADLREWLVSHGFEVGVHDLNHDGRLYDSPESFRAKARRINSVLSEWGAVGFRSGFMLRELDWLHQLNLLYDSSTFDTDPFEPQPDGAGTVFPFCVTEGESEYVELPYTLPQDSTLFLLLNMASPEVWHRKMDWLVEREAMALVNVHPDYISFEEDAVYNSYYPAEFYREFLGRIKDNWHGVYWHCLAREMAEYVRRTRTEEQLVEG